MPLYEFKCNRCGPIEVWRPMAQAADPVICDGCEAPARRIFSPPMLLSKGLKTMRSSSPDPKLVQRSSDPIAHQPRIQQASSGRPWMISH